MPGQLELDDVRIHYLDWGGDGAPLVVLHATGFHGRTYRVYAEAFRAIGHVYSMDQRGHGDSGLSKRGEYTARLLRVRHAFDRRRRARTQVPVGN
ncbi:MAG: alpha/beta fold hydrolase [Candidatus Binataceae bacterium]